jgi:phosphoribosylaminoimidazole-succinocarboxamide synthase
MANGFQGQTGQQVPEMTESWVNQISERYIELYENIIGEKFVRSDVSNVLSRVEKNVTGWIEKN